MTSTRDAPLLPEDDTRDAALFFVVTALCFLAALSAMSARLTFGAAEGWTNQVEGDMSVQLLGATEPDVSQALELITADPGVAEAKVQSRAESEALLEPWFGDAYPKGLPLPRTINLTVDPDDRALPGRLSRILTEAGLRPRVFAYEVWARDVARSLTLLRLISLGVVTLLGLIALAVIAFATHAALIARRDVVDVLNLAGANDSFIAGLFQRRFFGLGLKAGAVGALSAFGVSALLLVAARQSGERSGLLPQFNLALADALILIPLPFIAALAAMAAARMTVMRTLGDAH